MIDQSKHTPAGGQRGHVVVEGNLRETIGCLPNTCLVLGGRTTNGAKKSASISECRPFDSNRRDFLRVVGGSALAALMARSAMGAENQPSSTPENRAKI